MFDSIRNHMSRAKAGNSRELVAEEGHVVSRSRSKFIYVETIRCILVTELYETVLITIDARGGIHRLDKRDYWQCFCREKYSGMARFMTYEVA